MAEQRKPCLLIDDDDDDRLIFSATIKKYFPNYELNSYSSFEKSQDWFTLDSNQQPAVVFMDLNMPKTNGLTALKMIREQHGLIHLPVVIYSTSNNPDDVNQCLKAGATAFITKPSTISELVEEIGQYL
jgi:CheY-like chemotaxis protein